MIFARKHCVTVQEASKEYDIDTPDNGMTDVDECEEPVCGSGDPEVWDDESENYGEGVLGGNPVSDSDSEDDSDTESEIGLEDLDFDEDEEKQKEAELLTFSEALREAQVNAVALEKASQTTKRHRGKFTGKSLSTLNRIARANAMLAKSGQK
jgi:hypothetical protein